MQLITVDYAIAAQLLRDLAERVESGGVEIYGFRNNVWPSLHKGDITIEWREVKS